MARPRSEITSAVLGHLPELGRATWRDAVCQLGAVGVINPASPAECRLVRDAVHNAARRGDLQRVGVTRTPGSCRPMTVFAARQHNTAPASQALARIVAGWMR